MCTSIEIQFILSHNAPSHIFNSSTVVECPALSLHHYIWLITKLLIINLTPPPQNLPITIFRQYKKWNRVWSTPVYSQTVMYI